MNKLLIATAATAALAAAAPLAAQTGFDSRGSAGIDNRIARLEARVDAGIRSGEIDRREARQLRRQLRQLSRLNYRYRADGLSREERADLQARIRTLRADIRLADRGAYDRYERSAEWDDDDVYSGRGGPYEGDGWVVDADGGARGGIPGLFESLLGGGSGLRVGQRAGGNLYAVPSEYRDQFRDNGNAYFRSDGRRIYEIDARTHTVVRVYTRDVD